ncbi:glucose-6-phosphate isomerase, partial [Pelagibacterales bacterium SAG-MED47]|nr:glucose-6-phosphate isomerase [Pelagibacterales bacterium SAG-MED47]
MLTNSIKFKSFYKKKNYLKIKKNLKILLSNKNEIIKSLGKDYNDKYNIKKLKKIVTNKEIRLIGMGGSSLGAQAIYYFLNDKIKKKFFFLDNLSYQKNLSKKKNVNIIISKSGNTLETISNINIFLKSKDENIFITE